MSVIIYGLIYPEDVGGPVHFSFDKFSPSAFPKPIDVPNFAADASKSWEIEAPKGTSLSRSSLSSDSLIGHMEVV